MNTFSFIKIDDEGEFVSMVLNRPPLNVMNISMMKEINSALEGLHHHPAAKVLSLRADGKAFSAGVDVADHTADKVGEMMGEFHRMFELLAKFNIPTIAVVDGAALGGGCELAIGCDMIVASPRAKFGQPEIKVGVFPPIAAALLPRLIGRNRTLEFLLHGEAISAPEAERIGLINKVFPLEGFDQHVDGFIRSITTNSKIIIEMTKKAVDEGLDSSSFDAITKAEKLYLGDMMATLDAAEGLKAFLEKRQPAWRNR